MLETCVNLDPGVFEYEEHALFDTEEPVYILGKRYEARKDLDEIKSDLKSRLWFTYRRNFQSIGGTGPSSDAGWGCMLRCGQMMLAQVMVVRHLGRHWRWNLQDKDGKYLNILRMFGDKKSRLFSIHQIAQMGVSEGKEVGQWFGPNTAAQVIKKLTVYDNWTSLCVHVAMDNAVILEDIRTLCQTKPKSFRRNSGGEILSSIEKEEGDGGNSDSQEQQAQPQWRPLMLVIPLRLGLTHLNPCYVSAIKSFFALPQCIGIIGGRPNHALYFVGVVGDDLLYLDPHECQNFVDLDVPPVELDDFTFHCPFIMHLPIVNVDPSLALGLYCETEEELNQLSASVKEILLNSSNVPLFELLEKRPRSWPKFVPYAGEETSKLPEFTVLDPRYDSDEEFEILN